VREAIISLEMGGLVEVRVGTGIFVTAPAAQSAAARDAGPGPFELLQARKLIEGEIAAVAAAAATQSDLDLLRQCVLRMEAHVDDFAAREASDREFHLGIAKATGNGSLELVVEGLWNQRAELWGRMQRHFHTPEPAEDDPRSRGDSKCDRGARSEGARRNAPASRARARISGGLTTAGARLQRRTLGRPSCAARGRR
jgi:DNA-binding FadR family transcriptional regulator